MTHDGARRRILLPIGSADRRVRALMVEPMMPRGPVLISLSEKGVRGRSSNRARREIGVVRLETSVWRAFARLMRCFLVATGAMRAITGKTSRLIASASSTARRRRAIDAPPPPPRWPGRTVSRLLPVLKRCLPSSAVAPLPIVTMVITAATPMTMPTAVRDRARHVAADFAKGEQDRVADHR